MSSHSHLEHNQVVVMSLYLEDVWQSGHPRFEIGRITCRAQTRDDFTKRWKNWEREEDEEQGSTFYSLSRLTRGSTALSLLLDAASGSQFLYFSTAEGHARDISVSRLIRLLVSNTVPAKE